MSTTLIRSAALMLSTTALACAGEKTPEPDSAAAATASALPAPTEGFKTPESVRYDPALDAYFVSSIDGVPSNKDNNGFISRIDAANPGEPTVVVQGGQNGAELHAPKGMVIVGDTLWVTDIDVLRAFDKNTGAALTSVDLKPKGATFLNDVAVGPDGTLYITDSGLHFSETGEMTHPGTDRIFAVKAGTATIALEGDSLLHGPNGIAWDAGNARFVLAPFSHQAVSTWKPGETTVLTLVNGPGGYDGIEVLADGRIVVSSWADSSVSLINGLQLTKLAGGLEAPADIGVDTKRQRIAVPRFNAGRVDYVAIP